MIQQTLSIIKPDAVRCNNIGAIITRLESAGLRVAAAQMLTLSRAQAGEFYAVHQERPFYEGLLDFMTSGPVLAMVLRGENAIAQNREVMGATDPANAAAGTIRADFAENVEANAVHGSDSPETARDEIVFFFPEMGVMIADYPVLVEKVEVLDLSIRARNCLRRENIRYVGDLVQKTKKSMYRVTDLGRKTVADIEAVLDKRGLKFGMTVSGWKSPGE